MIPVFFVIVLNLPLIISGQDDIYGGPWGATAFWSLPNLSYDDPVLSMRAPSVVHVPAPLTTNWLFSIDGATNTLYAATWRNAGDTKWASSPIPGLNTSLPVLSVEAGPTPPDKVFLLDLSTGRLQAYAPESGPNPVWVSDFVCSKEEGAQHQWLGASTAAGVVVARCAGGLAVVDLDTGRLQFTIRGRTLPPTAPVPFLSPSLVATWRGGSLVACSLTKGALVPWSYAHPSPAALISSVAPSSSGVVAVTVNGTNATDTLLLLSAHGKLLSTFTLTPNATQGLTSLSILPTPTIEDGVLYGIATVHKADPLGIAAPALMWFAFAVNVSDPRHPSLLWRATTTNGWPIPQKVQLSKRTVYVSLHARVFVYRGFDRVTGQFAWDNTGPAVKMRASDRNITIATPTYCCETAVVGMQHDPDVHPYYTLWAHFQLLQNVVPIPKIGNCYCDK